MVTDVLRWPGRRWLAAVMGMLFTAAAVGFPTALLPNSLFTRMTPITWWSWPVWATTAVLSGLVAATYVRTADVAHRGGGAGAGGGLLSALAVGCPVCNKLIVAMLGAAGAMQWWAPVQPLLGVASVGLLAWALRMRLREQRACAVPVRRWPDGQDRAEAGSSGPPR